MLLITLCENFKIDLRKIFLTLTRILSLAITRILKKNEFIGNNISPIILNENCYKAPVIPSKNYNVAISLAN